jgi:hypothetical protein
LHDRRIGVVGEIGRALQRDEPVAAAAAVIRQAQQARGIANIAQREREEQLRGVALAAGGQRSQLLVAEI